MGRKKRKAGEGSVMKLYNAAAVFALALFALLPCSSADEKIIYGDDDRVEYYDVPEAFKAAADSTVSLWKKSGVRADKDSGKYLLATGNFGEAYGLCPDVRFREQTIGAFCSGSLVGEDLVLTAGHCIESEEKCKDTAFVFGYSISAPGQSARTQMTPGEVYTCSKVVKRQWLDTTLTINGKPQTIRGQDYALVKLDRKVTGRRPLAINRLGGLKKGDQLSATGHPNGLPFKFSAEGAVMMEVPKESAYFISNLDIFGGNSGGPAFNARTGLIEGIVVRADAEHFLPSFAGCMVYTTRPQTAGYGISINKLDEVISEIPLTPGEAAAAAGAQSDLDALRKTRVPPQKDLNLSF